tara:strand:- start:78 stop:314 length:237 start_codon:yes stop_codon:yes gene_type:complete
VILQFFYEIFMSDNYEQQLEFTFKPRDATPEQIAEWHEKEGKWWADRGLTIIAIASVVQFSAMGFMMLSFYLIQLSVG